MEILDELTLRYEQGRLSESDKGILLRLARLAEKVSMFDSKGLILGNYLEEIRSILHPAPAKGYVTWTKDDHNNGCLLAEGVTLDEARRRFGVS